MGGKVGLCVNQEVGNVSLDLRCKGFAEGFGGKVTVLPVSNDPADIRAKVKAALAADASVDTILALGAGTAGEPSVAAVKEAGKTGAIRVATFDLSAGFLKSVAAGEAAFAIDQQQYLQGYLPVVFLAQLRQVRPDPRRQRALRPEPDHQGKGRPGGRSVRQGHSLKRLSEPAAMPAAGSCSSRIHSGRRSWSTPPSRPPISHRPPPSRRFRTSACGRSPFSRRSCGGRNSAPLAGLVLVTIFFLSTADPSMFTLAGIMNILSPASQLGILAIAAALLMIGGEFDLSIGSMVAFAGLVFGAFITLSGWPLLRRHRTRPSSWRPCSAPLNGQIVIRTRLPSFIVTLAFLFILRGLSLVGLKWATGGSTQMRGIGEQAGEGLIRELFSGVAFEGLFSWLAAHDIIAKFPNGTPTVTGVPVSIVWFIALRAGGHLGSSAHARRQLDLRGRRRCQCGAQFRRAGRPGEDGALHAHRLLRPRSSPSSPCSMPARPMRGAASRRSSRRSSPR